MRESQRQPLVVVFEDLHWVDEETQALLDALVESLPTARLLLLVNYRPEYRHAWGSKTYYAEQRVDPLPPESADELIDALLGNDPSLAPLRVVLQERTGGNPFFLEESVRQLAETGALAGGRGAYALARPVADVRVPATVQAILASRIDRLDPPDKRLLQAAAVVGKDVPFRYLKAVIEVTEEQGLAGLARLQAAEFLYEAAIFPELEHTFKHALTHEVAYGSVLQERRKALHARLVGAIEDAAGHRLEEHAELLAHHATRGEQWGKAVEYGRLAGRRAIARSASSEAVAYLEQALAALSHLPRERPALELAIDVRLALRNALMPLGEHQRTLDYLREAEALAQEIDDRHRLARAILLLPNALIATRDRAGAEQAVRRAYELFGELGDPGRRASAASHVAFYLAVRGEHRLAADLFAEAAGLLTGPLRHVRLDQFLVVSVLAWGWLGVTLARLGEIGRARAAANEARRCAAESGHLPSIASAIWWDGLSALIYGDAATALLLLERAEAQLAELRVQYYLRPLRAQRAMALARLGRAEEAAAWAENLVDAAGGVLPSATPVERLGLAECHLALGRAGAATMLDNVLAVLDETGERAWLPVAHLVRGKAATRVDPPDLAAAESHIRRGLALAEDQGQRPLAAQCRRALGELKLRTGDAAGARAELTAALEAFTAMGMDTPAAETRELLAAPAGIPA